MGAGPRPRAAGRDGPRTMTTPVVLLVSLNFPPSQIASVHRARHLAKHLPSLGWRPIVVTVDERYQKEPIDPGLGELVSPSIEVHRVSAAPLILTQPFGLGDLSLRSLLTVRRKIRQLIESQKPSVAFLTGWPFYQMLLSAEIEKHGVPVVLDFQDPWVSNYGAKQPIWSKAGITHRLAVHFEPRAVRAASFVTSVSETQNIEMAKRYSWLDSSRMAAIPIGGDPDDFLNLRSQSVQLPTGVIDRRYSNVSFVGTIMPRSGPLVKLVLSGLDRLRRQSPDVGERIRLNFIGTSNQSRGKMEYRALAIAREVGVACAVHEIPQRLPFMQALSVLIQSECVLLIGSDEPHYTASKIYPALMSGRPFLSLFHRTSSSYEILSAAGGGFSHAYADGRSDEEIDKAIAASLYKIATQPDALGRVNPSAYAPYEARAIARQYADIFAKVSAERPIKRSPAFE